MVGIIDYSGMSVKERIQNAAGLIIESELTILSYDEDVSVRIAVAGNPYTSYETLVRLSYDSDSRVRCALADFCQYTDILRSLANDPSYNVRISVACNDKTPALSLTILASDPSWYIRYGVAQNKNTFNETLARLVDDYNARVREAALYNLSERMHQHDIN